MVARLGFISATFPLEIALALGYMPSLILPSGAPLSRAEGLLPRNFCTYLKLLAATIIQENLWEIIVVPVEDESHRRFSEVLKELLPGRVIALDVPTRKDEDAVRRFASQLKFLAQNISESLSPEAFNEAIVQGNELRRALKEARALWIAGKLDSLSYHELRSKAFSFYFPEAVKFIRETCAQSKNFRDPRPGIMLAGGVTVKRALIDLIEEEGFAIVAEDTDIGDRYPVDDIPVGKDLEENLMNLAQAYLRKAPSARDLNPAGRLQFYENLIRERRVQGVIFSYYKFCDPPLAEYPFIASYLKKHGIPCLLLEEEDEAMSGQNITRAQAFLEMIKCKLSSKTLSDG